MYESLDKKKFEDFDRMIDALEYKKEQLKIDLDAIIEHLKDLKLENKNENSN